jgi:hypothetical protein
MSQQISLQKDEVPIPSGIPYWNCSNIKMPWGERTYRWHGTTIQGRPKIVEVWSADEERWGVTKNVNVFDRIAKHHQPNLNTNE